MQQPGTSPSPARPHATPPRHTRKQTRICAYICCVYAHTHVHTTHKHSQIVHTHLHTTQCDTAQHKNTNTGAHTHNPDKTHSRGARKRRGRQGQRERALDSGQGAHQAQGVFHALRRVRHARWQDEEVALRVLVRRVYVCARQLGFSEVCIVSGNRRGVTEIGEQTGWEVRIHMPYTVARSHWRQ